MIKKVFRLIKRRIRNAVNNYIWNIEAKNITEPLNDAIQFRNVYKHDQNILVVAPHPDDELIGCFEVLKMYGNNADIYYTGLTGYDISDKNRMIRSEELKCFSQLFQNNLFEDQPGNQIILHELLKQKKYSYIFIPSFVDWHWEHRSTCIELLEGLTEYRTATNILFYSVTVPIPSRFITHYNILGTDKWDTFRNIYHSQAFMPIARFQATAKSFFTNMNIEPYFMIKNEEINFLLEKFKMYDVEKLNSYENEINSIKTIRKHSDECYKALFLEK